MVCTGSETTDLEVLCNFTDKALEGQLTNEQLCGLLVATDFAKSDGTGAEAMRLLHTTGRRLRVGLARRLVGELLAGRLA